MALTPEEEMEFERDKWKYQSKTKTQSKQVASGMEATLKTTGNILIWLGIILGLYILLNIDWDDFSKEQELFKQIAIIQLATAIGTIFSGVISGIMFLGFAEVLEVLKKMNHNVYAMAVATKEEER